MIRRPPRSTLSSSSAASDVYKRRASDKAARRAKAKGARAGYVYLHSAVDGFSRLAYTEHLPDEKATTTIGFFHRARAFFAAHGITRLVRVITDNGPNYTAKTFTRTVTAVASRHQRIRPHTPRHNGKVERYNRTLAEELLYARVWTCEAERAAAITVWNIHYNYHRPHTAVGDQPPASRLHAGVTNVMSQNTYARSPRPVTCRNTASMPNDTATIAARTPADPRLLLARSAASAPAQATAATIEIHGADPRCL